MSVTGLVRVTVASHSRRIDLVLPDAVAVSELVPELARGVGLLQPATVHAGYRLVTTGGQVLSGDQGLALQGIEDGALLTVTAGAGDETSRLYDDVVEALSDVVEREPAPWQPGWGRRTALTAAALLMALGAVAFGGRSTTVVSAISAVVALGLAASAIIVSRVQREVEAAVVLAWLAAAYAGAAGCTLAPAGPGAGHALAYGGGAAAAVGLGCLLGLREGRPHLIPPVAGSAVALASGLVVLSTPVGPAVALTSALTIAVLAGSAFPSLALSTTGLTAPQLHSLRDIDADPDAVDADRVRADARMAHRILLALTATVGLLAVSAAPFAVSLGTAGTLLAVATCLVLLLHARQHRVRQQVVVGLVAGSGGLVSVVASVLCLHPGWWPTAGLAMATAGGVLLAVTVLPTSPTARLARAGDLAESAAVVALVPLLVVAAGVVTAVRG